MNPSRHPFFGTLAVIAAFGFAQSAHAATVTWNPGGGTWDTSANNWTGGSPDANKYVNGDTANFTNTAGGTISLSGTIAPTATNVSASSGTYTFTGTGITSGTLTKTGAGTLILQNSNSHTGNTTVLGALSINSGGAITGGGLLSLGGTTSPKGTLQYDSAATSTFGAINVGNGNDGTGNSTLNQTAGTINATSLTLNNGFTGSGAGDVNLSGSAILAISGTTTVSNQVSGDNTYSTITVGSGTSFSSANINMTGAPASGRNAAGRITQDGGTVTTGTLKMARTTSSNAAARRGEYNLNGGILNVSSITQDAGTDTFGTFNFNGGTLKPTANNTDFMEGLTTAQIKSGGAKIDTNGKSITIDQALTQDAAGRTLTKEGAGTLTLSSLSNSYTGATLVSAGTLFVSGSLDSSVTVDGTSILGGGGTVGAASFKGTSFFDIFLAVSGDSLTSTTTISFATAGFGIDNLVSNGVAVDWSTVADGTYTLITGTLNSANLANLGLANAFDIDGGGGGRSAYFQEGSLQLVVVPEPNAATLFGGLGTLLLLRRRK